MIASARGRMYRLSMVFQCCQWVKALCWVRVTVTALVCIAAAVSAAWGQAELSAKMEIINRQIELENSKLKRVQAEQKRLMSELDELKGSIDVLNAQEGSLSDVLSAKTASKSLLDVELNRTDQEIQRLREVSKRRLRAMFMTRPDSLLEQILVSESPSDLYQRAYFSAKIRDYDLSLLQRLSAMKSQGLRQKQELEPFIEEQNELKQKLVEKKETVNERITRQEAILADLGKQQAQEENIVASLRAQASQIESVLASMTGAPKAKVTGAPASEPPDSSVNKAIAQAPFRGKGLAKAKGSVILPARGEIVQRFGKQKHPEFEDFIFNRGLELNTPAGSQVAAIAEGKVLYVGRMPGYGTIVILDHGDRYYSLYGRLAETAVASGQALRQGERVGLSGSPDERGRNLYFEIRKDGAPVNPQQFYNEPLSKIG